WRGVTGIGVPLARYLPVWVCAAVAGMLLLIAYLTFLFSLSSQADPIDAQVRAIGHDIVAPVSGVSKGGGVPPPRPKLDLAGFLAPEIAEHLVEVRDEPGKTTITLVGTGLFGSGSASLDSNRQPVLRRIADALNTVPGRVIVTGHTDSDPIPIS